MRNTEPPPAYRQDYRLYWFGQKRFIIAGAQLAPYLSKFDAGQKVDPVILQNVKPALVDFSELADGLAIRKMLPCPDGQYTAVLLTFHINSTSLQFPDPLMSSRQILQEKHHFFV